jgi:hypothetical protein
LITHYVSHSEGISANGTKYIANREAIITTPAGSMTGTLTMTVRCAG